MIKFLNNHYLLVSKVILLMLFSNWVWRIIILRPGIYLSYMIPVSIPMVNTLEKIACCWAFSPKKLQLMEFILVQKPKELSSWNLELDVH